MIITDLHGKPIIFKSLDHPVQSRYSGQSKWKPSQFEDIAIAPYQAWFAPLGQAVCLASFLGIILEPPSTFISTSQYLPRKPAPVN